MSASLRREVGLDHSRVLFVELLEFILEGREPEEPVLLGFPVERDRGSGKCPRGPISFSFLKSAQRGNTSPRGFLVDEAFSLTWSTTAWTRSMWPGRWWDESHWSSTFAAMSGSSGRYGRRAPCGSQAPFRPPAAIGSPCSSVPVGKHVFTHFPGACRAGCRQPWSVGVAEMGARRCRRRSVW